MYSIFISYKFEDEIKKNQIKAWELDSLKGKNITFIGESEDVRINGEQAIKDHLGPKLKGMSALLVLVGQDSHNRPWVDYEVQYAKSFKKKIIVMQIPGTTGGAPKAITGIEPIAFNPNALLKELNM